METVIIIGSGLAGLAFAQGLRKSSISFKIFECDEKSAVRTQGYRLRLHGEGLEALRSLVTDDVWDLFQETCPETSLGPLPFINPLTCELTVANFGGDDPQGKIVKNAQKPYTIDRSVFREVLLAGLEDSITYGKEYSRYVFTDSGIIAHFTDGTFEPGRLLVGTDGVRSAVRRQCLPQLRILDTKRRPIYGKTPLTPSFQKCILPQVLDCLSLIKDPQTGTLTLMEAIRFLPKDRRRDQRDLPGNYVYWVIIQAGSGSPTEEGDTKHTQQQDPVERARQLTVHWHPSLRSLIDQQDPSQTGAFRLLSSDPASLAEAWEPDARVTILGDAAHAMMPSTASGAVTALRDAELLARLLREQGISKESIGRYEEEMRQYASEAVMVSAKIGETSFGLGALSNSMTVSW